MQHNKYFYHQDVKIYCATNQIPELKFLRPHNKPHCVSGIGKHYNISFDPKLGHNTCAILRIPCACTLCTSIIDQPLIKGLKSKKQYLYQTVQYFTYWYVLGYFNNWNIMQLSHKATSIEEIDKIHQVVLDGISDNIAVLVQNDKYGAINLTYTTTMG